MNGICSTTYNLKAAAEGENFEWTDMYEGFANNAYEEGFEDLSKKFRLAKGEKATFFHQLRVVSSGSFILPGPVVEAMYAPDIHAVSSPARLTVTR